MRAQCTSARDRPRQLTLLPQAQHEALQQRRQEQQTDGFRRAYGRRAGIEGTISQAVRAFDVTAAEAEAGVRCGVQDGIRVPDRVPQGLVARQVAAYRLDAGGKFVLGAT